MDPIPPARTIRSERQERAGVAETIERLTGLQVPATLGVGLGFLLGVGLGFGIPHTLVESFPEPFQAGYAILKKRLNLLQHFIMQR